MSEFNKLAKAVREQFDHMAKTMPLFTVTIDKETFYDKYLNAFDSQELKAEHTCNCCKSFIRQYANVVGIQNGRRISLWDIEASSIPAGYSNVVNTLHRYISEAPIDTVFVTDNPHCGTEKTPDKKNNVVWNHFYFKAPRAL